MTEKDFPPGFRWGTATAAYQIEGAVAEDGRGPTIWDDFVRRPGAVRRGDTGDIACDHYHRWHDDFDLLDELGVNAYRFSIAWSRILPDGAGRINGAGLDFYERLTDDLLQRGISPMVTLYHWDLPSALQARGGWAARETADRFGEYVRVVADRLGDRVPQWLTLNEPYCSAFVGHLDGLHAPGIRDEATAVTAVHHLLLAHARGVEALRAANVVGEVGITLNLTSVRPASADSDDVAAAQRVDLFENRLFLDPLFRGRYPDDARSFYAGVTDFAFVRDGDLRAISAPLDFMGVNYYERHAVEANPADPVRGWHRVPPESPTITGIAVEPQGLREVLERVTREYTPLPVYVTETGLALFDYADPSGAINDAEREEYFRAHIDAARQAMHAGVPLAGFYPWSLMDNFEWAWGYGCRYGMYYVDYATQQRIPKRSALWYRDFLAAREVPRLTPVRAAE
ncbi:GH1 family beta-glucosidase [Microbacterium gorillae]|uniref:GH1 family beta-glucosidase n=1 Tax=Microbacterium gorillae TaxID=1231063 RepID=UPI0006941016|nr:GH1 family beta-glucosidase [Microbacterium gorillae]